MIMAKVTPTPYLVLAILVGCYLVVPSDSCYTCTPTPSPPPPPKRIPCPPPPSPPPPPPSPPPPPPKVIPCPPPPSPPPPPKNVPCPSPPPKHTPTPYPTTPTGTCPIDTLKLNACVDLLGGLVHLIIGQNTQSACCPVLAGVADLDAALCLCTTIKAKLINVNIVLPLALQVLINDCGKYVPSDYQCPDY